MKNLTKTNKSTTAAGKIQTTRYCTNLGEKIIKQNRIALNPAELFAMFNKMEG